MLNTFHFFDMEARVLPVHFEAVSLLGIEPLNVIRKLQVRTVKIVSGDDVHIAIGGYFFMART